MECYPHDYGETRKTTIIEDAVELLNAYEYAMSYRETVPNNGYLNESLTWWL